MRNSLLGLAVTGLLAASGGQAAACDGSKVIFFSERDLFARQFEQERTEETESEPTQVFNSTLFIQLPSVPIDFASTPPAGATGYRRLHRCVLAGYGDQCRIDRHEQITQPC